MLLFTIQKFPQRCVAIEGKEELSVWIVLIGMVPYHRLLVYVDFSKSSRRTIHVAQPSSVDCVQEQGCHGTKHHSEDRRLDFSSFNS